ncbi:MAG TPA: class I mannose-6-phosphate isomerase [Draconibacterium sp.]|nr:class I mannose-6-phosphate isomerase [Draconibacterium sp.]
MIVPEIILFDPNRVWRTYPGGRVLDQLVGNKNPEDSHFPEDWIASTTKAVNKGRENIVEGISKIELNDKQIYLTSLFQKYPDKMLGKNHFDKYGANTQFLLKFLDSAIRLHIQVHPTISFAQKYLNSNSGKTEAYVILGIRDEVKEPYIYLGFQKKPELELLKSTIEKQDIEMLLSFFEKIPIRQGDVFVVPGGLPHAIGEGVFMIEIMEPTDFVARLEFERGGYLLPEESRFMGKGIDFALNMVNFNPISQQEIREKYFCFPQLFQQQDGGTEEILIDSGKTPCFTVHKLSVTKTFIKKSVSFYVGIVIKGEGTITTSSEQKTLKRGDKFFIPHNQKKVNYSTNNEMEIILAFPPE